MSIRARLLVLALLAAAPLMIDRARLTEAHRTERIAALSEEALALTRRGIDAQEEIIIAVRSIVQVVARAHATLANSEESCGRFLAGATSDAPAITGLSVIGSNGRITCSTVANRVGIDASDRPYFQEAIRRKMFVVSDNAIGRLRGGVVMVGAAPIFGDSGEVAGVVAAGFELRWIERIATEAMRRPGAALLMVDDNGTVLAAYPGQDKWLRKSFDENPLVREIRSRGEGMVTTAGIDGVRRIYGFARVPETDAHLAIGLDEAEVLGRVDAEMRMSYLQFALIGLLVLFCVWFGGEHAIVRPIRSLARTAGYIGSGALSVNLARRRWAAEFAPLATALDSMARRLAEREEDLRVANTRLDRLASIDGLSGLANRRGFDFKLEAAWRRSCSMRRPLALLMIDIDHFKLFNDHYGHVAGDICLRTVGEILAKLAADADVVARYGGEEFALIFSGVTMDRAIALGESLRAAVEALRLTHAAAPPGHVTVSVGVASLHASAQNPSSILIEAADAALYAAKRRGRNTVAGHATIEVLSAV